MSKVRSSRQYLSDLAVSCEQIIDETQRTFSHLDERQLNWKPAPESWSIAQCFDHLNTTNAAYFAAIDKLVPAKSTASTAVDYPFRSGILGKLMMWSLKPGNRLKLRAPAKSVPSQSALPHTVLDDFTTSQRQLLDYIQRSERLDIASISMTSPLSTLVRLNLGDAYGVMVTHTQRHLLQAKRVRERSGFPA